MAKKTITFSFLQIFSRPRPQEAGSSSSGNVNLTPTQSADIPTLSELEEIGVPSRSTPPPQPPDRQRAAVYIAAGAKYALHRVAHAVNQQQVPLLWLGFIALVSGAGIGASLWLSQVPPSADCQKISDWSADTERLYCAEQAAQSGSSEKIIQSIQLVKEWSAARPLYPQAQSLLQNWSKALLVQARDRINQRDLRGALALANQIPASSPVYSEAQAAIGRWKEEWNRGQRLYDKIQAALQEQNWDKVAESVAKLALLTDPAWQERVSDIRLQVLAEQKAWQICQGARAMAKNNPPEKLGQAIALTDAIGRKTLVWSKAAQDVLRWRNTIFDLAATKLAKRDVVGASALINSVPPSVEVTVVGQDITRLVRASAAELSQDNRIPTLDRTFPLLIALQSVQQIADDSPFYGAAQQLTTRLEAQLQDLLQLQTAGTLANFGQLATLQAAIAQVKQIPPGRPRRVHAQTLLAEWQRNLQRLEDRPLLRQAQQWAKAGSLPQLRAAVNLANQIPKQRSSYPEIQSQVVQWVAQIQTIEDRPILAQAQAFATQGKWEQAIAMAGKISAGRSLYAEAQNNVGNWTAQLQTIIDRGTLDQAAALAEQGSLSRAIDLAASIGYGRSLYQEAQGAVARWVEQRAVILRAREVVPVPPGTTNVPPAPNSGDPVNPGPSVSGSGSPPANPNSQGLESSDPTPPPASTAPTLRFR